MRKNVISRGKYNIRDEHYQCHYRDDDRRDDEPAAEGMFVGEPSRLPGDPAALEVDIGSLVMIATLISSA